MTPPRRVPPLRLCASCRKAYVRAWSESARCKECIREWRGVKLAGHDLTLDGVAAEARARREAAFAETEAKIARGEL